METLRDELHVAHPSMVCHGTADEWEKWTGMAFPDSGDYVVPDALVPIQIDRTTNIGRYVEPNVWVVHRLHADDSPLDATKAQAG